MKKKITVIMVMLMAVIFSVSAIPVSAVVITGYTRADMTSLRASFNSVAGESNWVAKWDFNADGIIDIMDFSYMSSRMGKFRQTDLDALIVAFNSKVGDAKWNPNYDFNGDGIIDILDFSYMNRYLIVQ